MMIRFLKHITPSLVLVCLLALACSAATQQSPAPSGREFDNLISSNVNAMIEEKIWGFDRSDL